VALCQARISTKPLWGFSSSNPYHSQSRAEQTYIFVEVSGQNVEGSQTYKPVSSHFCSKRGRGVKSVSGGDCE
jgi:hypothetical protein